jgi:hypothetical protein
MSTNDTIRRGFLKFDDDFVLSALDTLNLKANAKVSPVLAMPLKSLQQRRDVAHFASTAPVVALKGLLEVLALEPLDKIIQLLGDNSESPTFEQLSSAVDELRAQGASRDDVVAVLVFAVAENFPAAPHCQRLLEEREDLVLPPLGEVASAKLLVPKETDQEVREKRRLRREEEKQKKRQKTAPKPLKAPKKQRVATNAPRQESRSVTDGAVLEIVRRRIIFTPVEQRQFDTNSPLVGTVVLVDIPFDAIDPNEPERKSKIRPALVVASSPDALLVLGIYSNPSPSRQLFQPWRRLGLKISYLSDARITLGVNPLGVEKIGKLSDEEWNALF